MAAARMSADKQDRPTVYNKQIAQLRELNRIYNETAIASGDWHVQNVKTISSSEHLTQQIIKQKASFSDLRRELKALKSGGPSALGEAIKEQTALRNAMSTQMTGNVFGKNTQSLMLPKNLGSELNDARVKYGMINQMIGSAATQTINWGKNTQWAGRQITVGLTMPIAMAAAGAGALALKVDQNLTRIAKVYDTTNKSAKGQEEELAAVREQSLTTATRLAQQYGAKMEDTIDTAAQLAAIGMKGAKLQQATAEVTRIATLGELDHQKAIDMTIALQTAFKLSNDDLSKSFNTMNAVENATSLSIDDIAEATPRAASAMAALGGTVNDMIVMLTAMKESGVNAAEGANALKAASATILSPPAKAKKFWINELGIDIENVAKNAKGNLIVMMKELAKETHGKDAQLVQEGITDLFGKWQFNRETALIHNLGDAMNGVANQTKKAMDTVGQSTESLQSIADQEIERWRQSVQGKFKRAVEGMKAQLVPFGLTILEIITPVMGFVSNLIGLFNKMPKAGQKMLVFAAAALAIVGPVIMLVGIFANMFGSLMKGASAVANLGLKFRAQTAEQAAAAMQAKQMTSAFDSEARSAAQLAASIRELTAAMEAEALANGNLPMGTAGLMQAASGHQRQVVTRDNGSLMYAAGSKDAGGKGIGGRTVSAADRQEFEKIQAASAATAGNVEKTERNYKSIGSTIGKIAIAGTIFATMKSDSDSSLDTWLNIGLTVAGIGMMFPGMFGGALKGAKSIGSTISGWFGGVGGGGRQSIRGNITLLKDAFQTGGIKNVGREISAIAPKFASIAGMAGKIFLPAGILAAGVIALKMINDELNEAESHQKALASSGSAWADSLGFTFSPGQLPGMDKDQVNTTAQLASVTDKMTKANKDLAPALIAAAKAGNIYDAAMQQALLVLSSGGTKENALQAFQASLQMAGINKQTFDSLTLQFKKVNLDNPDEIRQLLQDQLDNAFKDLKPGDINLTNEGQSGWANVTSNVRRMFGGDISSEARAAGEAAGTALGQGLLSTTDPNQQQSAFNGLKDNMNKSFSGVFSDLTNNKDMKRILNKAGVDTADQLAAMMTTIEDKLAHDKPLTKIEKELDSQWRGMANGGNLDHFKKSYDEMLDTIIQGMVDAGYMSEDAAKKIRGDIGSINQLRVNRIGDPVASSMDGAKGASDRSTAALEHFADSAGVAEEAVLALSGAVDKVPDVQINIDQATSFSRSTMEGTMGDIYAEADRRLQAQQQATINGIQARGDAASAAYDRQATAMDKAYDAMDKRAEASNKAQTKAAEAAWDARIERVKSEADAVDKAYDARIDKINATIEAEQAADDERQRIFEAEKTRISRLAEAANSSIDFNSALNSGNLDEAAKLANDASARTQGYAMDDAQAGMDQAKAAREKQLNAQIDSIKKEQEARRNAYDEQIDQINKAKDTAMDALKERQDAEADALKVRRDNAKAALDAERDANQKSTQSAVAAAQASFAADQVSLAMRLRELQAFVPRNEKEMQEHIARIQQAYQQYGQGLQLQGSAWSKFIANSLRSNIVTASNALLTDINWTALGKAINARISSGTGVTAGDLQFFIKNGRFPNQGLVSGLLDKILAASQGISGLSKHEGGIVRHGGGPGWTQKDRTGVPRSASPYPSEVPALLKRGEFVVNERATRENRGLLENINRGGNPNAERGDGHMLRNIHHLGGIARHEGGGVAETGPLIGGAYGQMIGKVLEDGIGAWVVGQMISDKIDAQNAAAAAAASGGTPYYGPMTGTIKGALDFARTQQGKPYIWGGAGPAGSDCSGFMSIIANYILGKKPPYGRIFATGNMSGNPANVGPFKRGGGPKNAFRIGVNPNSHTAGTLGGINVESGSGHGPMVGGRSLGANSGFALHYYLPQADTIPQLRTGGTIKYDNTLANLHKKETVLTEPLSRKLEEGVNAFARGGDSVQLTIDLRGSSVTPDVVPNIERAVKKILDERDSRNGRNRRIP